MVRQLLWIQGVNIALVVVCVWRSCNGECSALRAVDLLVIGVCPTHFQFHVDYR